MANYCRVCEQDFASIEAFDYHLPPARLSPREARLVHPDAADLAAWGLQRNKKGQWSTCPPGSFGTRERLTLMARGDVWPARLDEVGLGERAVA